MMCFNGGFYVLPAPKKRMSSSVSSFINLVGVGLERRVYQCLPLILPNFFTKKSASYYPFCHY